MRTGVGESEAAVVALDDAVLAADVARKSRVGGRVDVARHHLVASLEARRRLHLGAGGSAALDRDRDHVLRQGGHHSAPFLASPAIRCASSAWVTTPSLLGGSPPPRGRGS